jgi:thiaminase/transcriptional activator TenA
LHARLALQLGIDFERIQPFRETTDYVDFLLETAGRPDVGATVAAMIPCMRLYAHLGRELAHSRDDRNPYRWWIETYASVEMEELAAELEGLLDELADDSAHVHDVYRRAMRCELRFFDAACETDCGRDSHREGRGEVEK